MFSSFFAAIMIAASFAYYNYKFSRFNFINFGEWVFYTGDNEIFAPKEEIYILLVFSGAQEDAKSILRRYKNDKRLPVLAVDLAQGRKPSEGGVIYLTAGINTLLGVVHRFRVTSSPSALLIERQKGDLYKQKTLIERL
ncbi:MAG: hypothetical protein LBC09_07865 [Helicobacteraceae bacterium]|jgi:hypothetical protein|nr:hypothetical protein [Helicobacteraceae bacterium]